MMEATVIFDVGKTNKKILLFDHHGKILFEKITSLPLTHDEDGFPCEDITALTHWLQSEWIALLNSKDYKITEINFTAYGASFVHLGEDGKPVTPLYNYLKPIEENLLERFYSDVQHTTHFDSIPFAQNTCSPKLGVLNSGIQLYWLKHAKPQQWKKITSSLHLPQYLSYLITQKKVSDYTSLGCHTALWDFHQKKYSAWIDEDILSKLPPITIEPFSLVDINESKSFHHRSIKVGHGLHDSSAALIPYLQSSNKSFILISTGTWSIQLNPFNYSPLTEAQLNKDCLCYLTSEGNQVKASRILLGKEHDFQAERIATHFKVAKDFFTNLTFDKQIFLATTKENKTEFYPACMEGSGPFPQHQSNSWNIAVFKNAIEAYYRLVFDLTSMLKVSVELIDEPEVETLFVDGGFAHNNIFLNIISFQFAGKKIFACDLPQSTALGAFIRLHGYEHINPNEFEKHFRQY